MELFIQKVAKMLLVAYFCIFGLAVLLLLVIWQARVEHNGNMDAWNAQLKIDESTDKLLEQIVNHEHN